MYRKFREEIQMTRISSCSFIFNTWKVGERSLIPAWNCFTRHVAIVLKQEWSARSRRKTRKIAPRHTSIVPQSVFRIRLWPSDCDLISFAVRSSTRELSRTSAVHRVSLSRIVGTASIIAKEAQARWDNSASTSSRLSSPRMYNSELRGYMADV